MLVIPTPWPPVVSERLADPQGVSTSGSGGSGQGQLLDPVARTPLRNRRVGAQAVFAVVIGPLRVRLAGRNISVDALATHLIINRRLPHAETP